MKTPNLICYFGHHKCATIYIDNMILGDVCQQLDLQQGSVHSAKMFNLDPHNYIKSNQLDVFSYRNPEYKYVEKFGVPYRGFHVIRDPRDILVSAYFSHRNSHPTVGWPELEPFRKKLEQLDEHQGMLAEIDFIATLTTDGYNLNLFQAMQEWNYQDPNIYETTFEKLTADPLGEFKKIFTFVGLRESMFDRWMTKLGRAPKLVLSTSS